MPPNVLTCSYISGIETSALAPWCALEPWELTSQSESVVRLLLEALRRSEFNVIDEIAVHRLAVVEPGAVLKGPLIVGAKCLVAAGAYLRGGNWIGANCTLGPGSELKSSFVFPGTKLAHFNFVGDSILGSDVNLEAGSIICNHRNERSDKEVIVRLETSMHGTGCQKFGALVGDGCRIGANAVLAPGALLLPSTTVRRTELVDQEIE
jgi:NDP-sugar pyrophosphorylase family protein